MFPRDVRLIGAIGFAALVLTACSSTSTGPQVAAAPPAHGGATVTTSAAPQSPAQTWHQWAACMRQHGAQISDPTLNAQNEPQINQSQMAAIPEQVKDAAQQACRPIIAGVLSGTGGKNVSPQRGLAIARCMRSHGVPDFPDPDAATGALHITPAMQNEPAFQQAWQTCKSASGGNG